MSWRRGYRRLGEHMAMPALWARVKRWLRPPRRLSITKVGRTYLVLTLGIGLGALNTGNNLLYLVLGFLLSVIVMSGVLSERVLSGVRIRRILPDGAFAGERFPLRYEVTRDRGASFALRITERGGPVVGSASLSYVGAELPALMRGEGQASRRGPATLGEIELSTLFPLGLFEKSRRIALVDQFLVYPKRGFACALPAHAHSHEQHEGARAQRRDGTGDILGLRELLPMEDARRVHWRKSASVGRPLKVEREREDRQQFSLEVDPRQPSEALERACEEVAALSHLLLKDGHEVGLIAGARRLRPSAGPLQERRVLAALAWVGFDQESAS